jgi:DNA-directed RNA polymerase specialized sigma subunit
MENKTRNELKNLVAINAAAVEANEEVQMILKEMVAHGYDEKYMAALNEFKKKVIYYRYQKLKSCSVLYDKIESLEDEQEKRILKYRYIRGYRWEEIADKMGYSIRQIFNIHSKSIRNIIY